MMDAAMESFEIAFMRNVLIVGALHGEAAVADKAGLSC